MVEVWKDIFYVDSISGEEIDFRGLYQVSQFGRVRSLDRVVDRVRNGKTTSLTVKGKIMAMKNNGVYPVVCLYKGNVGKYLLIHRVVASMFVPNPDNRQIVNHKDCNPMNPCYTNLEWCDVSYNVTYNGASKKRGKKMEKEVFQYTLDGVLIRKWSSYQEAGQALNINRGNISNCVLGRCKSVGGYIWKSA